MNSRDAGKVRIKSYDLYEGKANDHLESPPAAISLAPLTKQKNGIDSLGVAV